MQKSQNKQMISNNDIIEKFKNIRVPINSNSSLTRTTQASDNNQKNMPSHRIDRAR